MTVSVSKEKIEEMLQQATDLVSYIEHESDYESNILSKMALDLYDNIFNIAGDEEDKKDNIEELNDKIYAYNMQSAVMNGTVSGLAKLNKNSSAEQVAYTKGVLDRHFNL